MFHFFALLGLFGWFRQVFRAMFGITKVCVIEKIPCWSPNSTDLHFRYLFILILLPIDKNKRPPCFKFVIFIFYHEPNDVDRVAQACKTPFGIFFNKSKSFANPNKFFFHNFHHNKNSRRIFILELLSLFFILWSYFAVVTNIVEVCIEKFDKH